jgi:hypothetical protein
VAQIYTQDPQLAQAASRPNTREVYYRPSEAVSNRLLPTACSPTTMMFSEHSVIAFQTQLKSPTLNYTIKTSRMIDVS